MKQGFTVTDKQATYQITLNVEIDDMDKTVVHECMRAVGEAKTMMTSMLDGLQEKR